LATCGWFAAAALLAGCDAVEPKSAAQEQEETVPPSAVVQTAIVKPFEGARHIEGTATVLSPDPLLQLDGDIRAAQIAAEFSEGQADRFRKTTSLAIQTIANAERQAKADAAQLALLQKKLSQTWGSDAPFIDAKAREAVVSDLASGKTVLVRLDFPELPAGHPNNVKVAALQGGEERDVRTMWEAPSGSQSMPGLSYFALVDAAPGLRAGDRARLLADRSESLSGFLIPSSAIVIFAGQTWAYVETGANTYERRPLSLQHPVQDAYLVHEGFDADSRVVVRGASMLLAREAGPGSLDDDDEGGGSGASTNDKDDAPSAAKTPSPADGAATSKAGDDDKPASPAPDGKPASVRETGSTNRTGDMNASPAGDTGDANMPVAARSPAEKGAHPGNEPD